MRILLALAVCAIIGAGAGRADIHDEFRACKYEHLPRLKKSGLAPANALEAFCMGYAYWQGLEPAPRNPAQASHWFGQAAKLGHAGAQTVLGYHYEQGHGVPKDYARAVAWIRKAVAQGYPDAMHHMGRLHTTGKGVERNPAAAREWFLKAAKGGSVDAIVALRKDQEREWEAATRETYQMAYKAHEARDYARAAALYRTAAGAGSPGAQAALGVMIRLGQGVPKNPEAAAVLFRQAAAKGLAQAQARLGFAYEYGEGVPANWAEAAKWCQAAARQFDRLGLYCLARMYQFGIGVPQDRARAIRLFDRAMDQGDGQSKFFASWLRAPHRCVGFRNEFERQRFLFVCEDPAGMAFTSESQRHGWLAAKVREVEKAGDALRRGMDEYGSGACGAAGGSWYGGGCRGEGGRYFDPGQQDRYGRPLW